MCWRTARPASSWPTSTAGHFDLVAPWPADVARAVAAQQWRGGEPAPGFDTALRDQAHQRVVGFHRRRLVR
jgi:hypothetical protein